MQTQSRGNSQKGFSHFRMMAGFASIVLLLFSSCQSMGPKTIPPDGFNYNAYIALQKNEQILLNIVRLRYAEVPFFLNVNSVINQYSRDARAGAGGTNLFGTPAAGADVNGGWSDRPTITYTPISGRTYSQSLLTPLPPAIIFFLIQSGWSVNQIIRLSTTSINGVMNETSGSRGRRPANPEFNELIGLLETIQSNGILGMDIGGAMDKPTIDIYFPEQIANDEVRASVEAFKRLLNLNPASNRFPIRYGLIQETPDELVIQTHSMLEILYGVAWLVDVPPAHVTEGRTLSTFRSSDAPLIRISSSKNRPEAPYVTIKTRDHWYYIDDRDMDSKRLFGIIQILLSLAEDGSNAVGPLISIGN